MLKIKIKVDQEIGKEISNVQQEFTDFNSATDWLKDCYVDYLSEKVEIGNKIKFKNFDDEARYALKHE